MEDQRATPRDWVSVFSSGSINRYFREAQFTGGLLGQAEGTLHI